MTSLEAMIVKLRQSEVDAIEEESQLCPYDGTRLEEDPATGAMLCVHRAFHV